MKYFLSIIFTFMLSNALCQDNLGYQKPPEEILELVDVPRAPSVLLDDAKETMILLYRNSYKSIEELSKEELRLGGLRIDPKTNIGSRVNYYNNVKIKSLKDKKATLLEVKGLPENPKLTNFSWSPDQTKIALTNTTLEGVELWVLDLKKATVTKLSDANLNANVGNVINWFEDGKSLLVKMVSSKREALINTKSAVPTGPTISENNGKKAQNRTYQDLLKNKNDEHNFEQLAMSDMYKVSLDGKKEKWLEGNLYTSIDFSPDGNYVLVKTIEKPFSYLVTYNRFPSKTVVYTKEGKEVETLLKVPLIEDLPQGFMAVRTGKRSFSWRNDKPSTLTYMMALDGGDPENEVEYRDEIFELEAPFKGEGKSLVKTINRSYGVSWGNDQVAVAYDYWWNTRNMKMYLFNPSDASQKPITITDRNYQDRYSDPGNFVTERNEMGSRVLTIVNDQLFRIGDGFSKEGQFPFVDQMSIKTQQTKRIYQSSYTDKIEDIRNYDPKKKELLVRIESAKEYPNYFFRNIKNKKLTQLTAFENPFKSIQDVHKEVITYKREDGLELSATLYLPVGYDMEKKEKMPMIMWAYPTEFKDKSSASQSTKNPNEFTYPYYGSMVYWVTRGYVVLDDASFPIVGEGDEEPNDSFRKQLVANAKAAIDAVDNLGYIDRERVAVGGHSYGAFMVANLLSHSDLFAAGIARSGAYNRTLTPFGFQSEERNYWEAPNVYYKMSPFMHADKMNQPLLLVHGEADNNSGTYPMQSERYFNALKGLGATVRLVMLPKESHGYRSKESILHLLWEQDQWLEKHVKNKKSLENK
ncbi:prolyl oligopeptidase family serine peptidase [Flammeovirga yaeyamensis]|uniref:Prolyl oligopeptidase family serine peptidase n=3 Tax=Flammeovirga yaeyamensis TaxID=367791 RepID=A0AAX1NF67_9BACT|nr:prolyl oligopeptidase family serine peptidase [Flammeovirga yaeyamensis]NMF37601.1 S9 family peptidase [Flammeovirga yaeyamensis]QWG05576.1 prolyl oligopeptidase family serine peptidase [Flammeovirga yaeyamensis]